MYKIFFTLKKIDFAHQILKEVLPFFTRYRYERLLRRARTEDLSEVSGIGCLYQSGFDRLGRPVVVFCGKWFPVQDIDLEKVNFTRKFPIIIEFLIQFLIVLGIVIFDTIVRSNRQRRLRYCIFPYTHFNK